MNSITFDGRLGRDAELRYTQAGEAILSFSVASDIGFGDRKTTNWFNCSVWGKRGESLAEYLKKGQQVTVYGQLTLRQYEGRDGSKQMSPDVRVNEISLQGQRGDDAGGEPAPRHSAADVPPPQRKQQPAPQQSVDDDIIPF